MEFRQSKEHEVGAWDIANVKLRSRGTIQPTIGAPGGRFVKGGDEISRPQFYREDSCLMNLFLEWAHNVDGKSRLKTNRDQLNHAALYKLATEKNLINDRKVAQAMADRGKSH